MAITQEPRRQRLWTSRVEFEVTPRIRARRRLRIAAVTLLALCVAWCSAFAVLGDRVRETLLGTSIVLGPWVVRAMEVAMLLLAAAVVTLVVARRLGPDRDPTYRPARTWITWTLAIMVPLSLICASLVDMGKHPTVLDPASAAGCHVVVLEQIDASAPAAVGILHPGAVAVDWIGDLPTGDDGVLIVANGDVTVEWVGEEARLVYTPDALIDPTTDTGLDDGYPPLVCDA